MPPINKTSGVTGVKIGYYKGKPKYWVAHMKRKTLTFKRNFPFTEEGKKWASEFYNKKLIEANAY